MEKDVKPGEDHLSVVNKCIESLEKLVNLKTSADRTLYVGSIERLQLAVCSEDTAMKHFVSNCTGGIPLLVAILEKSQDQHIRHYAIMIMEKMLLHKQGVNEYAQAFVVHGAVDNLLKLIVKCQLSWGEDFLSSLYRVTARIGEEDKKLPVKARFLGVLPVILTHIRTYAKRQKLIISIMKLLKKVMSSSVNATKLCKDGLPRELLHFLDDPKTNILIPILEAISEATRTRHAARQFVKEDVISRTLHIIFCTNAAGCRKLESSVCKHSLKILVHLTQIKIGREKLMAAGTIPSLLTWCQSLLKVPGSRYNSLVSLVSTVVQRCLPARTLPVRKLNNPVTFTFSESACHNESDSSDGRNDDTVSLASSTLSSADSGSDSDENLRTVELVDTLCGETIDHFSMFFDEIQESPYLKTPFASGDDINILESKGDFYDKCGPSPIIELKDTRLNSLIPKLIPKSQCVPSTRKDIPRKSQKSLNDTSHLRDTQSRSISSPSIGQSTFTKTTRKNTFSDSTFDTLDNPFHDINIDKSLHSIPFEHLHIEEESKHVIENLSLAEVYCKLSVSTLSVAPFVKLAYPDVNCCPQESKFEAELLKPNPFLLRQNILKHSEEMAHGVNFCTEIYNLDSFLNDPAVSIGPLNNNDKDRIYCEEHYDHLQFEARFESGNLRKVFWKGGQEYDIILNPDINSKSHIQWFYFEVTGMKEDSPYTFNIINMEKSTSQFNEGMCPILFSVRNHVEKSEGWARAGYNICYFRNHYTQVPSTNSILRNKPFYTLTFTVTFPHTNDVTYIAYHYPYTFTTLQTHLYHWTSNFDSSSIYFKRDELCKTLAGNSVPLITITAKPLDSARPYIFLTARVHPGESNSSWVMKGLLDSLFSNKGQKLRETYIFKIVPMLNPDGVINGCHRCSLSAQDLNRQWITPNARLHPTIYYTKSLLHYLASKNKKPLVFCDFHGHSRRSNSFFFGCNPEQSWWPNDEIKPDCESFKVLPMLMNEMAPTFSLEDCDFAVERVRESTGRVSVWRQFKVPLSYTLECSYGGCNQGKYSGYHMGIHHLQDTGMKLCQCLGKLVFDLQTNRVWSSIPVDSVSFPNSRHERTGSKPPTSSTSTESDEDLDDFKTYNKAI